jgi:hypothetical protein
MTDDSHSSSGGRATFTRMVRKLRVTGFILGLLFDPEDGGDTFLRNVGGLLPNYMELEPRISYSSGYLLRVAHNVVRSRIEVSSCNVFVLSKT